MGMNKICLFGASGHGKVIKDIVESCKGTVAAFFDDAPNSNILLEVPVFTSDKIINFSKNKFIISIGDNVIRKQVSEKLAVAYISVVHSFATVSDSVGIKEGTVVMAGTIINASTKIGKHCIINTNSVVEHDCKIEAFVHISPSATIAGNVCIGEGTHIGAGTIVIPNITIGKWCTIGAGTVIIDNVPDFAVVVGNPGKIIKYNNH
jgi:sugar O-acyltransferase (sialic acid O-acetyltransferase NeuD family)